MQRMSSMSSGWQCPRLVLFLVLIGLMPQWGVGQIVPRDPQPPTQVPPSQIPRDRVPPPRVGKSSIRGRVVDGGTGTPVARARVRVQSGPAGPQGPVLTDRDGAFAFAGLPAGSYTVMVEKATYLPGRYPEVGQSLRNRFRPLTLGDGEALDDITVPIFHGGAIVGRVVDAYGDPVDQANVSLLWIPRGGRPSMRGSTQTNDLGEFRVPRLQAGRYLLRVRPQYASFQDGRPVTEPIPQPIPTYFPNAVAASQAQPIVVNRGETISGVELIMAEGTPTLVKGMVLSSEGQPVANGSVNARIAGSEALGGFDMSGGTGLRPDGTFQLQLPPGEYLLEAQVMSRSGPNQVVRSEDQQFGTARVNVGGSPVEAITIVVGKGATASGRVVFEGNTPPPPSPGQARVPVFNPDGPGCRSGQATIAADWTFTVEGLSGVCTATPQTMFGRWTVKAVTFRGQNLMEQTVTFESGQHYNNVQIVVTDRRTQVDLRVTGDDGQPTRDYVALVFPINKEKWSQIARYARTYTPSPAMPALGNVPPPAGGRGVTPGMVSVLSPTGSGPLERLTGLSPGEYFAIAVDDIDAEAWQDPGVLEKLTSSAVRVVVSDDGPLELPLRRVKLGDVIR
jgi:hypothetical protein